MVRPINPDRLVPPCYIVVKRNNNEGDDDGFVWKQGDPIIVHGSSWADNGNHLINSPGFWVIEIIDKSAYQIDSIADDQNPLGVPTNAQGLPLRQRIYRLDLNELTTNEINALNNTGFLSINFQRAAQLLRDMRI